MKSLKIVGEAGGGTARCAGEIGPGQRVCFFILGNIHRVKVPLKSPREVGLGQRLCFFILGNIHRVKLPLKSPREVSLGQRLCG